MNSLTRRGFLVATSASVVASSFARSAVAAPSSRVQLASRFQLGIQMYSLRGFDLDTALKHAAELGFSQVELYEGMLATDASDEEIAATQEKVANLGMTISAHGVNKFTKNGAKNREVFQFAKKLGIKSLTADPDPDAFDSLDELVKEFDIRIAIHNHGPRHRYNKAIDVLHAIEGRDERIGACADLGHYLRSGQQATEVIRLLKGRLHGIHLKDFAEMKDKSKGVILGKGHLDVKGVFDALRMVNFPSDGAISLEYEENPDNPIEDIRQCVRVSKAAMG